MDPIVTVEHLVKRYQKAEVNAVDDISFAVAPGEFFTLLGPNGAGKTTTISILTTTLLPTSGTVRIAGHDVVSAAAAVRSRIGIIFQRPSLDLNLTAEENVRFHATLYGLYPFRPTYRAMPKEYRDRIEHLTEVVGLGDELFKKMKTYSGGMKRKLEIVRGLIHHPAVLFLDEPTTGLDPASRRSLWEYLMEVRRDRGTTIFLTTHYLEEAEQADTTCIVNKGKIVAYGTPDQLKRALLREYISVDADDRAALVEELRRLGFAFEDGGPFKVALDGRTPHATLRAIATPLTTITIHTPTLEDAYLAIVEEEPAGDSDEVAA